MHSFIPALAFLPKSPMKIREFHHSVLCANLHSTGIYLLSSTRIALGDRCMQIDQVVSYPSRKVILHSVLATYHEVMGTGIDVVFNLDTVLKSR